MHKPTWVLAAMTAASAMTFAGVHTTLVSTVSASMAANEANRGTAIRPCNAKQARGRPFAACSCEGEHGGKLVAALSCPSPGLL